MRLKDKVAVVTGGASGIGRATCELFAREGARVVVADRNLVPAQAVAGAIEGLAVAVDVSRSAEAQAMAQAAVRRFGRIDILVNNAGFGAKGTVETTSEEDWDAVMAVNLKGVYLCSRAAIPVIAAGGGGAIVNTASNVATVGIRDRAAYVASKGGVAALTRAMALDHVHQNIRVNCVAPGPIRSAYFDEMLKNAPDPQAFEQALAARSPMNRTGSPEEIAAAILFLASGESSFATGAMVTVDGGMTAW